MSATVQTSANQNSMHQLLEAVAERTKASAENANPPTSGPGGGDSPTEANYTEGENAKANTALNKEVLEQNGPEDTPPPEGGLDDQSDREPAQGATVATAGNDPAGESRQNGPAPQAEPGTSSEASLTKNASFTEKVAAWRERAGDVVMQLVVDSKVAAEIEKLPEFVKEKMAADEEAASDDASDKTGSEDASADSGDKTANEESEDKSDTAEKTAGEESAESDFFTKAANGNAKDAAELRTMVQADLAECYQYGAKLAAEVQAMLKEAEEASADDEAGKAEAEKLAADVQAAGLDSNSFFQGYQYAAKKLAMGEMPPEAAMPPAAGGGEDPAAADMAGASEEDLMAAIAELAAEYGVAPEELLAMLTGGQGGGMEGGGEPDMAALEKTAAEKFSAEKIKSDIDKLAEERKTSAIRLSALRTISDMYQISNRVSG